MKILKFFNLDYLEYGIKKNMLMPNWMKIDLSGDVIHISGIPRYSDINEILIRCINIDGYIIR